MRVAQVIRLDPDRIEDYERVHAAVWPEVLAQLSRSGIRNYSIHRYETLLFANFEYVGDDFESDMAAMADDETTRRWWAVCEPMQRPVAERAAGDWSHAIPEVFHVD